MTYHRFLGGPHDGEWHNVTRDAGLFLPPVWNVIKHRPVRFAPEPVKPEDAVSVVTQYVPFPLHVGKDEIVTLFIEQGMKPQDALMLLVEGYRSVAERDAVQPEAQR